MARRFLLPALAVVFAAPGLAGAATHTVKVEGMQFVPASLQVKAGDKVVWRNQDVVPHTATAAGVFDSRSIAPGQRWTFTARKKGKFGYVCTFHPGMKAVLVVQ